jgi:omega-6 fatty acid desaturase (delta-12 desaturase)
MTNSRERPAERTWNEILRPYMRSSLPRSLFQVADTVVPFVLLWIGMIATVDRAYGLTLLLSVPSGLLIVRLFMIQHDCGHGAFFRSTLANDALGSVLGIVTLVPYAYWRRTHAIHHGTSGNLDRRGFGDIDTLTIDEYLALSRPRRFFYRFYRNPLTLLLLGPLVQFVLKHRLPHDLPLRWRKEWASVAFTNVALVAVYWAMMQAIGVGPFLAIQIPVIFFAGTVGVFLFYVQHQFENTYWRHKDVWNYFDAAATGSSLLALPRVLEWFTANIGYHHVHHLCSKIPNYRLRRCFEENPELHRVTRLTLRNAWRTLGLALWDEREGKLVGFGRLRETARGK